jgi:hypothetical protein
VHAKEVNIAGLTVSRGYDRLPPWLEHRRNENAIRPEPERSGSCDGNATLIESGEITVETCQQTPGQMRCIDASKVKFAEKPAFVLLTWLVKRAEES